MLPRLAEMPPWAATVCERVGKTLVTQAVFRPASAQPSAARRPEPPAPTTTTSKRVIDELVGGHRFSRPRRTMTSVGRRASTAAAPQQTKTLAMSSRAALVIGRSI